MTIDIGLTEKEKEMLFNQMFRHLEKNVDWDYFCDYYGTEERDLMHKAYDKMMRAVFGSTYYGRKR